MKKELLIYLILFFVLTLTVHYKELIAHPIDHILNLSSSGAYGLGVYHPLIFTLFLYLLILVPRFIIKLFKRSLK